MEEELAKRRAAVWRRFCENFSGETDSSLSRMVGKTQQTIYYWKIGRNEMDTQHLASMYPDLDWNYILTGKAYDSTLHSEFVQTRKLMKEIENKLQIIEEMIVKN